MTEEKKKLKNQKLDEETEQKIINAYYDVKNGSATTPAKLYEKLNKAIPLALIKQVLENLKNKASKKEIKANTGNQIHIANPPNSWQCDLTFYTQFKKINSGYHILLNFINTNSKMLYCYAMKDKNANTVAENFRKFLNEAGSQVQLLQCDDGSEFKNKIFQSIAKEHKITILYYNKDVAPQAVSIVERMNRTIRDLIADYMAKYNTHKFIDVLPDLVKSYNNAKHSGIAFEKPTQVDEPKEEALAEMNLIAKVASKTAAQENFPIGALVKIIRERDLFEKGAKFKLSAEVYTVQGFDKNKVKIADEQGRVQLVYPRELKLVAKKYANPLAVEQKKKLAQDKIIDKDKKLKKAQRFVNKEGLNVNLEKAEKVRRALQKLA